MSPLRNISLASTILICFFLGCNNEDEAARLNAELVYLKVQTGDTPDSVGRSYFRELKQESADKLYKILSDHLKQLELDITKPQKHYDAECMHSFGSCKIKREIETAAETLAYMLEARHPRN